ncbi:MAG: DUF488 domain-containing protein [Candidatus Aenigmatarchaeota archaeon]
MKIYTIGHSTRTLSEFISVLKKFKIDLVVDVRRFPKSTKYPHFNKENLEKELPKNEIEYLHFPELGGYRKEGYEAFSKTEEFSKSIEKLLEIINGKIAGILCSEYFWFRCHRRYIANYLAKIGHEVVHIFDEEKTQKHKLKDKDVEEKMKLIIYFDKKARKFTT